MQTKTQFEEGLVKQNTVHTITARNQVTPSSRRLVPQQSARISPIQPLSICLIIEDTSQVVLHNLIEVLYPLEWCERKIGAITYSIGLDILEETFYLVWKCRTSSVKPKPLI